MPKYPIHLNDLPCSMCKLEQDSGGKVITRFYREFGKVVGDVGEDGTFTNIRYCQRGNSEKLIGKRPNTLTPAW